MQFYPWDISFTFGKRFVFACHFGRFLHYRSWKCVSKAQVVSGFTGTLRTQCVNAVFDNFHRRHLSATQRPQSRIFFDSFCNGVVWYWAPERSNAIKNFSASTIRRIPLPSPNDSKKSMVKPFLIHTPQCSCFVCFGPKYAVSKTHTQLWPPENNECIVPRNCVTSTKCFTSIPELRPRMIRDISGKLSALNISVFNSESNDILC